MQSEIIFFIEAQPILYYYIDTAAQKTSVLFIYRVSEKNSFLKLNILNSETKSLALYLVLYIYL